MDGEGYFINSDWLCMIGPYQNNQRFKLIKWVRAGLIIISINGHSKWIQKIIHTWKHSHQPATPSPSQPLISCAQHSEFAGHNLIWFKDVPEVDFVSLMKKPPNENQIRECACETNLGLKGSLLEETVLAAANPILEQSVKWPVRRSA